MRLGLFDSGVGGLSVLDALLTCQPRLSALYLADTAWLPYGTKAPEDLLPRIARIVQWLTPQVDALVVACNTSAALVGGQWPAWTQLPVFDPISSAVRHVANCSDMPALRGVGIMATPNTVNAMAYPNALRKQNPALSIRQVACPGLADAVEQGTVNSPEMHRLLNQWMAQLDLREASDALILGCTHYPFALSDIRRHLRSDTIRIINPAQAIAQDLNPVASQRPAIQLVTTGNLEAFQKQVQGLPLNPVIKVAPVYTEVLP